VVSFLQVFLPNSVSITLRSHVSYISCPSQSPSLDQSSNIWLGAQVMKIPTMQFSPASCYFLLLRPNDSSQCLFSGTLILCSSLNVRHQNSHPYKTTGKYSFVYFNLYVCILLSRIRSTLGPLRHNSRTPSTEMLI
jgi:hypothetical protein